MEVDAAGVGGLHGAEKRKKEKVAGQRENPAGESSGVGDGEGCPEASVVAETPGEIVMEGVGE